MSSESLTAGSTAPPAPPAETSTAAVAAAGKPKPKFDPRYIAPLFVTVVLIAGHFSVGILKNPIYTGTAILTAILFEAVLGRFVTGKTPHMASAYVTGISVGILVRSLNVWVFALTSAISITSKYVFRVKGRHIWNPSNFGISMVVLLAADYMSTLSIQWGNSVGAPLVIWCLGLYIVSRLNRLHICLTYVLSFLAFAAMRSAITGHNYWAEISPITGPMYQLFIFFMITDPKTTVTSKRGQYLVAFLIAFVEALIRLSSMVLPTEWERIAIHGPYYALFTVGPIANIIEMKLDEKKGGGQPRPAGGHGWSPAPPTSTP